MKNISNKLTMSVLLCMCFAAQAVADNETYLRLDVGGVIIQPFKQNEQWPTIKKSGEGGVSYDIGYGYRFTENVRSDVTIGRWDGMKTKGYDPVNANKIEQKFSSTILLLNAYVDWPIMDDMALYIAGGIGAAFNKSEDNVVSGGTNPYYQPGKTKDNFAWSIGIGGVYNINESLDADLQYRYYDAGKVVSQNVGVKSDGSSKYGEASSFHAGGHVITLGLKYKF